jgi:hypothetical protein
MPDQPLDIRGISRAAVAADGSAVTVSLVDREMDEYDIRLTWERLAQTIVKLLAVSGEARNQRIDALGEADASPAGAPDALLPFPLARYSLGLSEDGEQAVLRLMSDNDLIWDFRMPLGALAQLRADIDRLEGLPAARDAIEGS